jgi:hypothetical protein
MRFGKRLALAMIRDAGEAPYISQKDLKHVLVGLEKLCKAYVEQSTMAVSNGLSEASIIEFANGERLKYGLHPNNSILDISEISAHDAQFVSIVDHDVVQMRRYVEKCEASLMEGLNELLELAAHHGLVTSDMAVTPREETKEDFLSELSSIDTEWSRVKQYTDVNVAAIRKLLERRKKNVAEIFRSVKDYKNESLIRTPETDDIARMIDVIRSSIPN